MHICRSFLIPYLEEILSGEVSSALGRLCWELTDKVPQNIIVVVYYYTNVELFILHGPTNCVLKHNTSAEVWKI